MSYIFPSGTKRIFSAENDFDFAKGKEKDEGKEDKKEDIADENKDEECKEEECKETEKKTDIADENKDAVIGDEDFALNAIKDLPDIKDRATALIEEIKGKVDEVAEVIQEDSGAQAKVEEIAAIVQDNQGVDGVELEIEDEEPNEIDINVKEDGSASIPGVEERIPAEEVDITIGEDAEENKDDEEPKEVADEVEIEIEKDPREELDEDDIVKKSKEACGCAAKSKGEFVRLAKLSPKNKEAIKEYWLALGFPPDYVESMVKDY